MPRNEQQTISILAAHVGTEDPMTDPLLQRAKEAATLLYNAQGPVSTGELRRELIVQVPGVDSGNVASIVRSILMGEEWHFDGQVDGVYYWAMVVKK